MTFTDCITFALHRAQDRDVPSYLLPLTIADEAALLAGLDSDRRGAAARR
ncbi:MAG: hypothetical protein IPI51_12905 [Betaproteobacteria bacterium]|nr:hypothetical protein [Betaproteobacteria bacterium]MBK7516487.1 hypothetical protein [Betaproteobacteria bacterium]MBK8105136.1 hypothetical protein [Betaproteobacteria bacterium]MBK8107669.1 hypothetical protein [Betaproteobacteria bacterium]